MKQVSIYKAQPIGDESPEGVQISIMKPLPTPIKDEGETWQDYYARAGDEFQKEADTLEVALWTSLPSGTYDRLFAAICRRKASLYFVSNDR